MKYITKYPCIRQHDLRDCGPACLATICESYGLKLPVSKIRVLSETDLEGTSIFGMIQAAEKLGFQAEGVRTNNKKELFNSLQVPLIAHIITDKMLLHFVVIHKITNNYITVADPEKSIIRYKPDDFFKLWTGILILMTPTIRFQKGNQTKSIYNRFWNLIFVQKKLLLGIFFASILVTAFGLAGSLYYQLLIDNIIPRNTLSGLHILSISMLILSIFKVLFEFLRKILLLYMAQKIDIPLMLGYYNHVVNLPMNFFSTRKVGEIISRFRDGDKIRNVISQVTLTLMIDTLMSIIGGVILYMKNSKLFFLCFIPITLYMIFIVLFKNKLKKVNLEVMEDNAVLTSYLVESLEGIETIKAYNREDLVKDKTKSNFLKLIKSGFTQGLTYNVQESLMGVVSGGFAVILLWFGGSLVLKNEITIGELITFNVLLTYFIEPISRIINLQPHLQEAIVASDRLGEILDLELEKQGEETEKPDSLYGDIVLEHVNFAYGFKDNILNNVNIHINQGQKIALVGESGSGKTTIAKLLMGFYKIKDGKISINTYNINDIDRDILRDRISYISQDSFFFTGTIRSNLEFAYKNVTYDDMISACKKAQIHEYIMSLHSGYDFVLEERGMNLSGGQRQRLSIARALLKKPDIVIMDEATSNLDLLTESAIQKTLEECVSGMTTIIIAHRLSTIKQCDSIYVIDKGNIVEEGSHKELINKKGIYFKLWSEQGL
ncbi:peptidase domain-containing ABC transporter [Lacrimispora sp.]|uniref:peptidase domain-containing ABC transporter n=1 Tax=Lacrimispora sp. TaxID=2719234 RepID=UPI0028AD3796|nr:peptidase domain-containing ABC transporter [Lacrimispora sp.]